ncbi:MAG: rod shape-determining protein RodA [Pseudomonadota bacterium]
MSPTTQPVRYSTPPRVKTWPQILIPMNLRGGVLILFALVIGGVGMMMQISAAEDLYSDSVQRHGVHLVIAFVVMMMVGSVHIRVWKTMAYPIFIVAIALLVAVEFFGQTAMGAQRWLSFGPINLQPSELMKVALIMGLARFLYRYDPEGLRRFMTVVIPVIMIAVPVFLVAEQPDLGTAVILCVLGFGLLFASGLRAGFFIALILIGAMAIPLGWNVLRDYQRERIIAFINADHDPLGAGYHIAQSKIAFGAGGFSGRGFGQGTQSHLQFLPEIHTDFIFTMLGEEFGFIGAFSLLIFYVLGCAFLLYLGVSSCYNQFARLVAIGVAFNIFLYVSINVAMVSGLIPVVGVPLPLISYGGTSMIAVLGSLGLVISAVSSPAQREEDGLSF